MKTFKCAICEQTFEFSGVEIDMREECERSGWYDMESDLVCDQCYQQVCDFGFSVERVG